MPNNVIPFKAPPRPPPRRRRARQSPAPVDPRDLALEASGQGISVYNRYQELVFFNRRYAEIYGLDPGQLHTGMTLREVVDLRYRAGTGPKMTSTEYRAWLAELVQTVTPTVNEIVMSDGAVYSLHHQPTPDGGFIGYCNDITERHRVESRIRHMAHHDSLTGVPNRALFFERLDQAIASLGGDGLLAVMFLDLDNFKDINDTLGHAAGDELLQHVTGRFGRCLRDTDLLARLGGDEFAILLGKGVTTVEQVEAVAHRVIESVSRPFTLAQHEMLIGVTIGFTTVDGVTDTNSAALVSQADLALYHAKAKQRGTCCAFEAGMDVALARRTELERDLRRAMAEQSLEVHFQPVVGLATSRIVGAEALVRWHHPRHGMVSPSEFIPLAEAAGLINRLGTWVLETACAQAACWGDVPVAVNLSPEQVRHPDLVEGIERVLAETGLPPHRLELEITEGILLRDTRPTIDNLNRLRALGIGIALDDFGTGYSSLSYLRRYPFSKLKIDRSFIEPMSWDTGTADIVRTIISLGHTLGLRIIAEGIESEAQIEQIRALGCDEAQGFLFGRPCPADAFALMLEQQGSTT